MTSETSVTPAPCLMLFKTIRHESNKALRDPRRCARSARRVCAGDVPAAAVAADFQCGLSSRTVACGLKARWQCKKLGDEFHTDRPSMFPADLAMSAGAAGAREGEAETLRQPVRLIDIQPCTIIGHVNDGAGPQREVAVEHKPGLFVDAPARGARFSSKGKHEQATPAMPLQFHLPTVLRDGRQSKRCDALGWAKARLTSR